MSDDANGQPPASFWIISGVFLVWNAIGLTFYYGQVTMTAEFMAANFTEAQIALMESTPVWATAAYATAVNAGVIASLLLLLRKSWAKPMFIVSLVGVLFQDFDAFVLSDVIGAWGTSALYLPIVVLIICGTEIWYSRSIANRYYR